MKARCPECSTTYDVPQTDKPRRARCKCGATFLLTPEEPVPEPVLEEIASPAAARSRRTPDAPARRHNVKPTRTFSSAAVALGVSMILFKFVWGILARSGVVAAAGSWDAGRGGFDASVFSSVMLLILFPTIAAGIGLILSKGWGWWLALVIQGGALLMSGKYLWAYLGHLNWDHPKAEDVLISSTLAYGIPFLAAFAFLTGLFLPSVRLACGVKSRPLPKRAPRRAGSPRAQRS